MSPRLDLLHARLPRRAALLAIAPLVLALLPACASESLEEPEPTIFTRGAFIALRTEDGLRLSRTLDTFEVEYDTVIVETEYDVTPESWLEARELSKIRELPIRQLVTVSSGNSLAEREHQVVWYRTLTEEEESRAR